MNIKLIDLKECSPVVEKIVVLAQPDTTLFFTAAASGSEAPRDWRFKALEK